MRFRISMKTPDVADVAIDVAVREAIERDECLTNALAPDEREYLAEMRREKVVEFTQRWLRHGEQLTVEFDTDDETATVVPV
jgi:hypothetical protein